MNALIITHSQEENLWYYQEEAFTSRKFTDLKDLFAELEGLGKVPKNDDDKREF